MTGFLVLPDGSRVPVRNGIVIGRTSPSDVVVQDGRISRRHARLLVSHGVVEIEDLGSSNGTLLNGKPVTRRVVRDGDRIQLGTSELAYIGDAAAPAAAAPALPQPPPLAAVPSGLEVLEFADEDVVTVRARSEAPASGAGPVSAGSIRARAPGRVLQFSKVEDRRGLLGDDLRQMAPLVRVLIWLLAVAAMAGAAWLAARLVG